MLHQHPKNVSAANAAYQQQLCSLLGVSDPSAAPLHDTAGTQATADIPIPAEQSAAPPAAVNAGSPAAQVATAAAEGTAAVAEPGTAAVAPDEQSSVHNTAVEAGGVSFSVLLDLFSHYIAAPVSAAESASEQEAATAAEAVATAKEAAATAALQVANAATAAAADAAAAAAAATAAPPADAKAAKGGSKDPKAKPAAAAGKAKEAAPAAAGKGAKSGKPAAEDKAAAVEVSPVVPKFVFGGIVVPKTADGTALCQEDSVPADIVRVALTSLQVWLHTMA